LVIKALCEQQIGMKDLAEETLQHARSCLCRVFDRFEDFHVACAYAFLSLYESGCGRMKTAKFYAQSVDFYFNEMTREEAQSMTVYQHTLKRIRGFARLWIGNSDHLAMLPEWPHMFERTHGISVPVEWKETLAQEVGPLNYFSMLQIIDSMYETLRNHFVEKNSPKFAKIFELVEPMVICAMRIAILTRVDRGRDIVEDSALRITLLTEHEYFVMMPPPIVSHVVLSARIHLHIVKCIERGERENPVLTTLPSRNGKAPVLGLLDYYDVLSKDFRALNMMSCRFKKVNLFYRDLLNEMETVLHQRLELQLGTDLNLTTATQPQQELEDFDSCNIFDALSASEDLLNEFQDY